MNYDFDSFQQWTVKTVQHDSPPSPTAAELMYLGLGLAGEFGEVANKIKKIHRDDEGTLTPKRVRDICEEIGDGMWYLARILSILGLTMEDVLIVNVNKLEARLQQGTIKGDQRGEEAKSTTAFTADNFVDAVVPDEELDEEMDKWWITVIPAEGPLVGREIERTFYAASDDLARSAARRKYGSDSTIIRVGLERRGGKKS